MSRVNFSKIAEQIENDGYQRGYRQAVKDVRRALGTVLDNILKDGEVPADDDQPSLPLTSAPSKAKVKQRRSRGGDVPSAQDLVFEFIRAIPGQRGAQIVGSLEQMGTPVEERTVRTALWRLRKRGMIEQRGNEWYVAK